MKKVYTSPRLTVHGDVHVITQGGRGHAYGLSCGNGNVGGPSSCGNGVPANDDKGKGRGKR